jgi:hypothetical protein
MRKLPRDNDLHVKYRIAAASTATALSVVGLYVSVEVPHDGDFLAMVGARVDNLVLSMIVTVILMAIFYAGKLI